MLINKNTIIVGENVALVPYRKEHVLKYHEWMKSSELQELTASVPLSLDEEYQMQQSWMCDENKCTFIVLKKSTYLETKNEIQSMIGDTNLFLNVEDNRVVAEAEIMIAETIERGKRYGYEAILLMLLYGIDKLNVSTYIVKISDTNVTSVGLFEKIGFLECSRSAVFEEITLKKIVDDKWIDRLKETLKFETLIDS